MLRWIIVFLFSMLVTGALFAQSVLKPGDIVIVKCEEESQLDGEYTVTDSGLLLMLFIGAVEVKGLTEDQAAKKISNILVTQQILRKATVTVRLKGASPAPVSHSGAIRKPGEMDWKEGIRLHDVIIVAEPSDAADLTVIRITRLDGTTLTVDYTLWQRGDEAGNPELQPGDKIFVPIKLARSEITILGAVARPGLIAYSEGMRLSDAIQAVGGLRRDADSSKVSVKFKNGETAVIDLSLPGTDIALAAGDEVFIPIRAAVEFVYVRGAVARPGLIPYDSKLTLTQVLEDAQPITDARVDRVKIVRKVSDKSSQNITVNVAKILSGSIPDVPLEAGDIVDVPYPGRSYNTENTLRIVGLVVLAYLLFRR